MNGPFKLYVLELWSKLPLKLFVVESCTTYCVTIAGLRPAVQLTVIDVKFTAVHVDAAVAGMLANVAVVGTSETAEPAPPLGETHRPDIRRLGVRR